MDWNVWTGTDWGGGRLGYVPSFDESCTMSWPDQPDTSPLPGGSMSLIPLSPDQLALQGEPSIDAAGIHGGLGDVRQTFAGEEPELHNSLDPPMLDQGTEEAPTFGHNNLNSAIETSRPYFLYKETFPNGKVLHSICFGNRMFHEIQEPYYDLQTRYLFVVEKDRKAQSIQVAIRCPRLHEFFTRSCGYTWCSWPLTLRKDLLDARYFDLRHFILRYKRIKAIAEATQPSRPDFCCWGGVRMLPHKYLQDPSCCNHKQNSIHDSLHFLIDNVLLNTDMYSGIRLTGLLDRIFMPIRPLDSDLSLEMLRDDLRRVAIKDCLVGLDNFFDPVDSSSLVDESSWVLIETKIEQLLWENDTAAAKSLWQPFRNTWFVVFPFNTSFVLKLLDTGKYDSFLSYVAFRGDWCRAWDSLSGTCDGYERSDISYHPLYVAIRLRHKAACKDLYEMGHNFSGMDQYNLQHVRRACSPHSQFDPLTAAIKWGHADIFRYFFHNRSANVNIKGLASNVVWCGGDPDKVQILMEEGIFCTDITRFVERSRSLTLTELLAARKSELLHTKDLSQAAQEGYEDVVRNLLIYGVRDDDALFAAAAQQNYRCCKLLVESLDTGLWHYVRQYLPSASPAAMAFLLARFGPIPKSLHERMMSDCQSANISTRIRKGFESAYKKSYGGKQYKYTEDLETQRHSLLYHTFHQRRDQERCRERRFTDNNDDQRRNSRLGISTALMLKTLCSKIMDKYYDDSFPQSSYSFDQWLYCGFVKNYKVLWRRGMSTVRRLLGYRPPATLPEVLDVLLVSYAVSLAQDTIKSEFIKDLDRWRLFVPTVDLPCFDLLASHLWNYAPGETQPVEESRDLLLEFEELVGNLLPLQRGQRDANSGQGGGGASGNLFEMQQRYINVYSTPSELDTGLDGDDEKTFIVEVPDPPQLCLVDESFDADSELVIDPNVITCMEESIEDNSCSVSFVFDEIQLEEETGAPENDPRLDMNQAPTASPQVSAEAICVLLLASVAISIIIGAMIGLRSGFQGLQTTNLATNVSNAMTPVARAHVIFSTLLSSLSLQDPGSSMVSPVVPESMISTSTGCSPASSGVKTSASSETPSSSLFSFSETPAD